MSQDSHAVPYQRASYEQDLYQAAPYSQPVAPRPAYQGPAGSQQPPTQPAPEWSAGGQRLFTQPAPEWPAQYPQYPHPQPPHVPASRGRGQETVPPDQSARPASPASPAGPAPLARPAPPTQSAQLDPETALAVCQKAERKATRGIVGSVLCIVGIAAIILVAALTHQLDAHIETTGPVFMLLGLTNLRRLVKLRTRCRTAAERLTRAA